MSSFEYVMVIVSIIMGLGVATLLKGVVNIIRADNSMKPGLLQTLWVSIVLTQHVGLWSLRWAGERREDWPFLVLFAFMLLPILYYAQAELLFPADGREVELNEYFLENRRPFFMLAILGYLAAAFGPFIFYEGVNPIGGGVVAYFILALVSAGLAASRNARLHTAWAALNLILIVGNFSILAVV